MGNGNGKSYAHWDALELICGALLWGFSACYGVILGGNLLLRSAEGWSWAPAVPGVLLGLFVAVYQLQRVLVPLLRADEQSEAKASEDVAEFAARARTVALPADQDAFDREFGRLAEALKHVAREPRVAIGALVGTMDLMVARTRVVDTARIGVRELRAIAVAVVADVAAAEASPSDVREITARIREIRGLTWDLDVEFGPEHPRWSVSYRRTAADVTELSVREYRPASS